ncbi:hypothetical protein [Oxynema aestuarii]|uniref:Uncharacterized protein n=1 Tax=Oxynema aestuarii AP17 TaxID=2064643 RepID=A0A6H1TZ65_9CYAN|nr:hypothetical protein [Oxynema aestuarii]QIZ71063.1 hypothetical protein HCG48_11065 [Oxynema aestuarii AP17]
MSISLIDIATYYEGLPHQKHALEILQQQIESDRPALLEDGSPFTQIWRNSPQAAETFPRVEIISNSKQLQAQWGGETFTIDASEMNVFVMDAPDPETGTIKAREMSGDRIVDYSVDPQTGNIAVGVMLNYYAATTTSAVFIIDPQPGGYAIYRGSIPGPEPLPDRDFSTYSLSSIQSVRFVEGYLQVVEIDPPGNMALVVFKPSNSPAMEYSGCLNLEVVESTRGGLCSNRES